MSEKNHYDCLILGAGISGIDAGYYLQQHSPWASFLILDRRENLGGTWDFFKYPGIRSDSDMFTFGFSWKIWRSSTPIATAEEILTYLNEAADEQGLREKMRFKTDISVAEWKSSDNRWHLTTTTGETYSCNTLFGCMGYYSYENPNRPEFPGEERFKGKIIHPQLWDKECDKEIKDAKVALVGSGATSVTLLPNITDKVEKVTMVQRTPTYIAALPGTDRIAELLKKFFPMDLAVWLNRWKQVLYGAFFYQLCTRYPNWARKFVRKMMWKNCESFMSQEEFDKHFSPPYNPWQQRFCLAPKGDFYKALGTDKADIVTGHIETFTENGIKMKDGTFIEADLIIGATGLTLQQNLPFSTIKTLIDGKEYKANEHKIYNSIMLDEVPNFGFVFGYTNASWTLKADISALYFTKMINYMRDNNIVKLMPVVDPDIEYKWDAFSGGLSSGYIVKAAAVVPKMGDKAPWNGGGNYIYDLISLSINGFDTESLKLDYGNKKTQ